MLFKMNELAATEKATENFASKIRFSSTSAETTHKKMRWKVFK